MNERRKIIILISSGVLVALFLAFVSWLPGSDSTEQIVSDSNSSVILAKPTQEYTSKYITIRQTSPGAPLPVDADEQNAASRPQQLQNTTQEGPQSMTDEQIFDRLWPPVYREALQGLETHMVDQGFIKEEEKHLSITSDADMYSILLKIIDYMESRGWTTSEDATKLREGLMVHLPKQIEAERTNLRKNGVKTGILLPRDQHITSQDSTSLALDIIDGLKYVFSAPEAQAQFGLGVGWYTAPDCYKNLAEFNPVPGFNSLAFCCNCGLSCVPPLACVFVLDCGPFSTLCTIPLGCLNLNCKLWPNAIWDGPPGAVPPYTFTCGCG